MQSPPIRSGHSNSPTLRWARRTPTPRSCEHRAAIGCCSRKPRVPMTSTATCAAAATKGCVGRSHATGLRVSRRCRPGNSPFQGESGQKCCSTMLAGPHTSSIPLILVELQSRQIRAGNVTAVRLPWSQRSLTASARWIGESHMQQVVPWKLPLSFFPLFNKVPHVPVQSPIFIGLLLKPRRQTREITA